jgi:sugar phosphate isomerase/epimerase
MTPFSNLHIGFNARLFPNNWRPVLNEIHASMLHISDTRLPETNEHLPLGMGTVDFARYCQLLRASKFHGPAILEIGGLPKSGGYDRDTDAALIDSLERLRSAYNQNA